MANNKNLTTATSQATVPTTAVPTKLDPMAKEREQFFSIYPEIKKLYESFGDPSTTLRTDWFDVDISKNMGRFVTLIKKLELDELFPNWEALKTIASLTDAGTIASSQLTALQVLCKKGFQINTSNDEVFQLKGYRDIAAWLISRDLDKELDREDSIIYKGLKIFDLNVKDIKDSIVVEELMSSLGIVSE